MIYKNNAYQWPASQEYLESTVPFLHKTLTTINLQRMIIRDVLTWPFRLFSSRADLISKRMQDEMGITIPVNQLPKGNTGTDNLAEREPRWIINATCFESGANFRFESLGMGDYKIGYVDDPEVPLSDAIAASAGFPVLVGPLGLKTDGFEWYQYKDGQKVPLDPAEVPKKLHLWDGGVYDNLGLEALVNYAGPRDGYSYRRDVDYLMISNASGESDLQTYKPGVNAIIRMISISKYQVESLRSRDALHRMVVHKSAGRYFDSDNYCGQLLKHAGYDDDQIQERCKSYLTKNQAAEAARIATEIKNLTPDQFMLLFRQGFEVADCTLHAFETDTYQLLGFDGDYWRARFD
jgi:NTE family protein